MNLKRIISLFLLFSLLFSLLPMGQAAKRGVSLSSDSSFFAQLNLNTAGMEKVKAAVSAGNYTTAKSELLQYYKTKFATYNPIPADSKDANRVFLAMHDTWSMSQNRIAETTIKGTGFNFYSFGKTTNTAGCYVLDILDRPDYAIQLCTRETADASHRPVLKCYDASGKLLSEVVASADAMIHKGKPDTNYGTDNVLYVKSGMTQNSDGTYLPYNANSRRIYMRFNVPSGTKHTELVIYARLHGASATNQNSLPLYQFASFNTSWTESNLTWNYLVNLKAMGHYSWKDIPGAFDWKKPEGMSDYDWLDSNSRFYELVALAQTAAATTDATQRAAYFAKLKEILLDFIADTNVRTGFPANRDRETSSRMMNFPYIYKQLLTENVLTANENKTILAYVYDELTFMDNGATIFDNVNGNHGASAYTNHSVYHLAGFYAAVAYWPEFKNNANWRKRYESRVDFVLTTLINSDGSYNEVSFGYPRGVLTTNSFLMYCMQERNDTSATGKKFIQANILLARYLMDCSYPNGKNPYWGEGSTSSAIRGHIETFLSYLGSSYDTDPNVQALRHFVNNAEGTAPNTVARYTPVKIVTDRTGWSAEDSMFFMNAKSAGYHGHRDALAILYYYNGRSLLTDTGTTSASSSHPHYNFQHNSTRSHNTIEIDGKAQTWQKLPSAGANMGDISIVGNDSYSSVSSWTKANTNDISTTNASGATVTHSTDFTHYRHVSYMKELGEILFVSDKVVPGDSASHSYTQNWHSAPYSNPSIAADAYDTGRTNFSDGANLLIAQANGGSTTGSLQTGYDSSASATTTKYFQYKKTGTGTVSYQTVLYPMGSGTTATVQPTKITMSGTSDATALASRISVNDSSRPTVKTIYHYHAFESTPSTRSFDAFTTNAGTVTLVQDGNNKLHFAALSKGSSVSSGNAVILKASATVTDLAATLENGVLSVESSDPSAEYATITVNFSGQTVHQVYYNGNSAGFTRTADGTVTIHRYPMVHFNGHGLLSNISQWTPHGCTAAIKDGTMTGSLTGSDPYVKSVAAFAYPLQKGDIVEIRIQYNITSGSYSGLQFFWLTEDAPQYNGTNRLLHSATTYPANEYTLVRLNIPDSSVGDVMTGLRVDPVGTGTTDYPTGTYTIDYIYVGPPEEAPGQEYTVIFRDTAGNTLQTLTVKAGGAAVYSGTEPTKAYDEGAHYSFAGWVDANGKTVDLNKITSNLTLHPTFTPAAHALSNIQREDATCEESGKETATCTCGYRVLTLIPAKGHSYVYTKLSALLHVVTCKSCDLSEKADHSYTHGLCICGEPEIKEPILQTNWKIGHSLNLAGDISVNLVVSKSLLAGFDIETVYILTELDVYDGNTKTATEAVKLLPVAQGNYYYFTLTGLTAVQMNDRIRSVLYGTKDGQPYCSPVDEYSIATYAYSQLNNTGVANTLKILCADLLRYGAKAQIFKTYRTNALVDANMTNAHKAYLSDIAAVTFGNTNKVLNDLQNAPITWAGKSLNLESKVTLKFVFQPANYRGNLSDLTLRISYQDVNGTTMTQTLDNPELYDGAMGLYGFTVDVLLAAELRSVVSVQIFEGNTPVSCTLQYSADTYGNNKTGTLLDLCKALFAFSDSAKTFFTSN